MLALIDFPFHFDNNGKKFMIINLIFWIFKNIGFINGQVKNIESQFESIDKNIDFLLIKTGFGNIETKRNIGKVSQYFLLIWHQKLKIISLKLEPLVLI